MKLTSSLVAGALLLAGTSAFAQSASASATASANIITSLALVNNAGLSFGSISPSNAGAGTVTVTSGGVRSALGSVTLVGGATGTPASFTANGTGSQTYTITLPSSATLSDGTPAHDMTVNAFSSSVSSPGTLGGGTQTFTVGATVAVAQNQVVGTYTGSFSVTVAYQ